MPTIHEVKAGTHGQIGGPKGIVDRLAQESKARTRRRLIVRTGAWLAITAVALVGGVVVARGHEEPGDFPLRKTGLRQGD